MKFFHLFALIAGASAVHLTALSTAGAADQIEEIFHQVDTNGNGEISWKELKTALLAYAKSQNHKITKADRQWVRKAAKRADWDGSKTLDLDEFRQFAYEFAEHYNLDEGDSGDDGYDSAEQSEEDDEVDLHNIFNMIDTSDDGLISSQELISALTHYAKQEGHEVTDDDKRWLKETVSKVDNNQDGHLDFDEFVQFAHEFGARYHGDKGEDTNDEENNGDLRNIFNMVDSSGDGLISGQELETALRAYAKQEGHKVTADDENWVKHTFAKVDGNQDGHLDFEEFVRFAHAFGRRYEGDGGDDGDDKLRKIFDMVDTSGDGLISQQELEAALRAYAKQVGYKITPADEQWVEETAGRADADDNDHLDYDEFVQFAHEFAEKYFKK